MKRRRERERERTVVEKILRYSDEGEAAFGMKMKTKRMLGRE